MKLSRLAPILVLGLALARPAAAGSDEPKSVDDIIKALTGAKARGVERNARSQQEDAQIALPIHFTNNSSEITSDSIGQLQTVAAALRDEQLRPYRFVVEGHTDNQGSDAYNLRLSERRAQAVRQYLVQELGMDSSRLQAKGYGKRRPLAGVSQDTDEGRALNRRVVFVNLDLAARRSEAAPPALAPEPADTSKLAVRVVVNYQKGGKMRVLAPNGILAPNDNYRITFTPNRDSYVYVYQMNSTGNVTDIFPNAEYSQMNNPVRADRHYVVPHDGQWLRLYLTPGDEEIVVVASETELADPKAVALEVKTQDTVTRGPAPVPRHDLAERDVFSYTLPFKRP